MQCYCVYAILHMIMCGFTLLWIISLFNAGNMCYAYLDKRQSAVVYHAALLTV